MIDFFYKKTLLLFLLSFSLFGQTKKTDLMKLPYDTLKKRYFDNSNDKSKQFEYAGALLVKAQKENLKIQIARGYYLFSLLYKDNRNISCLDSVIKYSKNNKDVNFNFPALAYSDKAYAFKKQFKFKEAIDNFILAEKYAYKNNLDFYYKVRYSIAVLKSEELGDVSEALELYKECYIYYKDKNVRSTSYSYAYQDVLFGLADAYKSLGITDSASFYNREGCRESKATNDDWYFQLFVLNEGANLVLKKKYRSAIDSINSALPKIIHYQDVGNTLAGFYYLGKANQGLGNSNQAAKCYIKVDSIYKESKDISPEFMDGYHFLIDYYKQIGNQEKQFEFTNKLLVIDSVLNKNYKELTKKLQKEYDVPHLISKKESLIQSLKKDKIRFVWIMIVLLLVLFLASVFAFYQRKLKRKYRTRFEKIVNQTSFSKVEKDNVPNKSDDIGIVKELVTQILNKIADFEKNKLYLKPNITIQSLSSEFDTNTKYISKIINTHKQKTVVQYINDLRIEHAILTIQNNKTFRKYTIHALALEFGFNNAESFSSAFYKKTGIKPTFFISELDKV